MIRLSGIRRTVAIGGCALALCLGGFAAVPASAATPSSAPSAPAAGSAASPAAPAAIPAALSDCPAHSLCLWHDAQYMNTRWTFTYGQWQTGRWIFISAVDPNANDQASSIYNNRAWMSAVSKDYSSPSAPPNNLWACLTGGSRQPDLSGATYTWLDSRSMNDSISGIYLSGGSISGCPKTF